jgi:hypothetical protein
VPARIRPLTAVAAIGAAAVISMTAACAPTATTTNPAGSSGTDGEQTAAPAGKPGLTGKAIVLTTHATFSGDDAVTDASAPPTSTESPTPGMAAR